MGEWKSGNVSRKKTNLWDVEIMYFNYSTGGVLVVRNAPSEWQMKILMTLISTV